MNTVRYAAFISYNHRDRRWAEWLHRSIENYRIPKEIALPDSNLSASRSLRPVFLDRAELSSSADLAGSVREALEQSAALIVICSPAAAQSRWVNEEVRTFKALGRGERIFCLVVDGDPASGDCFPSALDREPLAADVRRGADDRNDAKLKLIAGLLTVPLDRLRQREAARRQKRLVTISVASIVGCVAFATLATIAFFARAEAQRQAAVAERQSLTAKRTADFLKSLFVVSDPSESRGNTVTAREVLDRGAHEIETNLHDAPLVRADLLTTLGEVYASLGLLNDGVRLLNGASTAPTQPPELVARRTTALAEVQFMRGDDAAALAALDSSRRALDQVAATDNNIQLRMLSTYADIYDKQEDVPRARVYFQKALQVASSSEPVDHSMRARALEGIAQQDLAEKQYDRAVDGFSRALAEQTQATGEMHPRVAEILNQLGSLEYLRGRPDAAINYFRRCLSIQQRVLGSRHSRIHASLNNLGRLLLERRQFAEAKQFLSESIDVRKGEVLETSANMAFEFSNLALADMGVGHLDTAEPLFQKGLKAAILNKHRLHGPILTDLADLECRSKRYEQGLKRLDEARPIVAARYPDDPWRVAHVDNVRAGCLTGLKRYPEATQLILSSLPIVLQKWRPDSLYGHDALQRKMRLYESTRDPRLR